MRPLLLVSLLACTAQPARFRPEWAAHWQSGCQSYYVERSGIEQANLFCECMVAGGSGRFTERQWAAQTAMLDHTGHAAEAYLGIAHYCADITNDWFSQFGP